MKELLKPEEVTSFVFEKAVFGGYEISSVDRFLSQLTEDYVTLYRENELLSSRLLAMSDRIEEYRANEDAMRLALLSARKNARELAEKSKAEPEMPASEMPERMKALSAELKKEQAALQKAKEAAATYLTQIRAATAACETALSELCGKPVPELPTPEDAVKATDAAAGNAAEAETDEPDFSRLSFRQS